jgi:predicted lipoprotein
MAASRELGPVAVAGFSPAGGQRKARVRLRGLAPVVVLAIAAVVVLYFFPLFRIAPLPPPAVASKNSVVVVRGFPTAEKIWTDKLMPAARTAPPLAPVLAAVRKDPAAAAQRHGHRVGLGRAAYYFGRGTGRVVAAEGGRIVLAVDDADSTHVVLRHGPLFGNAVRDGTGLLDVNDFPGLQEFNALAAELNRLVEAQVFPAVRELAQPGRRLAFAGVAEAPETVAAGPVLALVPLHVESAP